MGGEMVPDATDVTVEGWNAAVEPPPPPATPLDDATTAEAIRWSVEGIVDGQ